METVHDVQDEVHDFGVVGVEAVENKFFDKHGFYVVGCFAKAIYYLEDEEHSGPFEFPLTYDDTEGCVVLVAGVPEKELTESGENRVSYAILREPETVLIRVVYVVISLP